MKPYDMTLTKTDGENEKTLFLEMKASKGKKPRFFLSEAEMQFLKSNAFNYRLFFISRAGTEQAGMSKISKLHDWIEENRVEVKEHKKFEVIIR
jgi:hypothetical protein